MDSQKSDEPITQIRTDKEVAKLANFSSDTITGNSGATQKWAHGADTAIWLRPMARVTELEELTARITALEQQHAKP